MLNNLSTDETIKIEPGKYVSTNCPGDDKNWVSFEEQQNLYNECKQYVDLEIAEQTHPLCDYVRYDKLSDKSIPLFTCCEPIDETKNVKLVLGILGGVVGVAIILMVIGKMKLNKRNAPSQIKTENTSPSTVKIVNG